MFYLKRFADQKINIQLAQSQIVFDRVSAGLERDIAALKAKNADINEIASLKERIIRLEADMKIERSRNSTIEAEQKAKYAEHVMKVSDERVAEISKIYDNYAKTLTDVVKAAHQPTINNVVK